MLDEAEDMVTVLSDDISWESLDRAVHGMSEPSGDKLAVTLKNVDSDWIVANQ